METIIAILAWFHDKEELSLTVATYAYPLLVGLFLLTALNLLLGRRATSDFAARLTAAVGCLSAMICYVALALTTSTSPVIAGVNPIPLARFSIGGFAFLWLLSVLIELTSDIITALHSASVALPDTHGEPVSEPSESGQRLRKEERLESDRTIQILLTPAHSILSSQTPIQPRDDLP